MQLYVAKRVKIEDVQTYNIDDALLFNSRAMYLLQNMEKELDTFKLNSCKVWKP